MCVRLKEVIVILILLDLLEEIPCTLSPEANPGIQMKRQAALSTQQMPRAFDAA
jgi:hypothetical protein